MMDTRRDLLDAHPLLAQISKPSTDKDAFIPVHPGAAVYYDGEQKTFFDKYGDQLFYGSILLGSVTSIFAGAWKFMRKEDQTKSPLNSLYSLADRIRLAHDESDLTRVESEIDHILKSELAKHANGESNAADAAVLGLAAHRLEYLLNRRRDVFQTDRAAVSATQPTRS